MPDAHADDARFRDALAGLHHGDFSRLEPLFHAGEDGRVPIVAWHAAGRFRDEPAALAEALTCACFLGRTEVAAHLLAHGVDPASGAATGLDALHWAANRGQAEAVRLLLRHGAPFGTRNMYGGDALEAAIWSVLHEPRPGQLAAIEALLDAGARLDARYPLPIGHDALDALLGRYGPG
ncbi:MAG TPA: ankyrin repeat domain-containing protein [Gemmatimonadales bacterium]|nr:ankyrin repeat domain-containing protein [Gemmatimonadales bacterium]